MIYPYQTNIPFTFPEDQRESNELTKEQSSVDLLHFGLCRGLSFTSKNNLPIVDPIYCEPPSELLALHRIKDFASCKARSICPHLFTPDKNIERLWRWPFRYLKIMQQIGWTISPDFSILTNMVKPQKIWNDFRNKLLSAFYQFYGVTVIPAPAWGDVDNIEYYMEGWPHHSLIAINSTGVCNDKRSRHIWLDGYLAMLDILQPTHILRYGGFVEGESKDISTYYDNNNKKGGNYGW